MAKPRYKKPSKSMLGIFNEKQLYDVCCSIARGEMSIYRASRLLGVTDPTMKKYYHKVAMGEPIDNALFDDADEWLRKQAEKDASDGK